VEASIGGWDTGQQVSPKTVEIDSFSKAKEALKANGRVAIIDFYHDDRSGKLGFPKHHLVPREQVIEQMKQAGLTFLRDHTFLPRQYFLEFVGASSP